MALKGIDNEIESIDVGKRLRALREERGISMRALARRSGLSANALSMIERGLTSPSVSTLIKLANALEVPITAFFRPVPDRSPIVYRKSNERSRVLFQNGIWEGLGGEHFSGRVEAFMLTLEKGGTSGPYGMVHSGHEFVYCVDGSLEYEIEGQTYNLEPGDNLIFAAQMLHRWRNSGKKTTRVIVVISSFEANEHPSEFHLASGAMGHDEENGENSDAGLSDEV